MGQRLQNTVPSIMQVRSEEKPIFSSPKVNSNILSAVVSVTAAMSRMTGTHTAPRQPLVRNHAADAGE